MGVQNNAVVPLFKNKNRFADLFNAVVFDGNQIVKAEKLAAVDSESDIILEDKNGNKKGRQRYRDVIMRWQNEIMLAILACEVQDKIHYAMPVRNMMYDL